MSRINQNKELRNGTMLDLREKMKRKERRVPVIGHELPRDGWIPEIFSPRPTILRPL